MSRALGWALGIWVVLGAGCDHRFAFDVYPPVDRAGASGSTDDTPSLGASGGQTDAGISGSRPEGEAGSDDAGSSGSDAGGADMGGSSGAPSAAGGAETLAECQTRCQAQQEICAPEWMACVQCNADADCVDQARRRCDGVLHRCVACGTSTDCPIHQSCDPVVRECVPACNDADQNAFCPNTSIECDDDRQLCIACRSDSDCAASPGYPHCISSGTLCVQCLNDAQCADPTPYCDPVLMACVACRDSRDCGSMGLCDPTTHVCQ